ncbi:hypothetical protein ACP275_13G196200 [Erythranthe tilingii]
MAYSLHRVILIALLFAIAVPSSLSHTEVEKDLMHYCSHTGDMKIECRQIIQSEFMNRFNNAEIRGVVDIAMNLTITKASEISGKLVRLSDISKDENLIHKYLLCSQNYRVVLLNLDLAHRNLHADYYRNALVQIDNTVAELKSCSHEFTKDLFDPAYIRNMNKEFRLYVEIFKVTLDRLIFENDND